MFYTPYILHSRASGDYTRECTHRLVEVVANRVRQSSNGVVENQQVLVLRAEIRQCRATYDGYYSLHSKYSTGSMGRFLFVLILLFVLCKTSEEMLN